MSPNYVHRQHLKWVTWLSSPQCYAVFVSACRVLGCLLFKLTSTSSHARPRTSDSSAIFMTFPVVTTIRRQHLWPCQGTWIFTVSSMNFRINLYAAVLRYELLRYWYSLMNWDALINDGIVFHIGHAVGALKSA